ncbi:PIG-L family deacetylase, partial [Clostridium perfringens]|nr:PIG-L family deacetylase [Clostridium perfringens]
IVTCGNEELGFTKEQIKIREKEIFTVTNMYGFKKIYNLKFPTTQLEKIDKRELVERISKCISEANAEILYIPNWGDVHSDHRIVAEAAMSCTKWFRNPSVKTIYAYETLSETEFGINNSIGKFNGNVFVNIEKFIDKKIDIM